MAFPHLTAESGQLTSDPDGPGTSARSRDNRTEDPGHLNGLGLEGFQTIMRQPLAPPANTQPVLRLTQFLDARPERLAEIRGAHGLVSLKRVRAHGGATSHHLVNDPSVHASLPQCFDDVQHSIAEHLSP